MTIIRIIIRVIILIVSGIGLSKPKNPILGSRMFPVGTDTGKMGLTDILSIKLPT